MRQAESIQFHQRVLDIAHHRTHPRKPLQPLSARGAPQRLATRDRRGQHSLQAFGIALVHAIGQKLPGGTSAARPRLPSGQVALGLRAANGKPGQREAWDQRVGTSTVSTAYPHDANPFEEVILVIAAVTMELAFNPTGGTTYRRDRSQPPAPHLGGVIVFLRTVEYKYCVGLGVGDGPAGYRRPFPISRPSSGNPQLQQFGNFPHFLKPKRGSGQAPDTVPCAASRCLLDLHAAIRRRGRLKGPAWKDGRRKHPERLYPSLACSGEVSFASRYEGGQKVSDRHPLNG